MDPVAPGGDSQPPAQRKVSVEVVGECPRPTGSEIVSLCELLDDGGCTCAELDARCFLDPEGRPGILLAHDAGCRWATQAPEYVGTVKL